MIESLKDLFLDIRQNIDMHHNKWYEKAVGLADQVNVPPCKPRTCSHMRNRDNPPAETESEYFKRVITIPLVDHLNTELQNRFNPTNINSFYGLSIIPANIVFSEGNNKWKEDFKRFVEFYLDDLPNPMALDAEIDLWEKYWVTYNGSRPVNACANLKFINFPGFENIKIALRI